MKTYFKIDVDTLRDLLIDSAYYHCLEANGVDNWIGYLDNRESFIADTLNVSEDEVHKKDLQLSDIADKQMQDFEILKED